MITGHDLIHQLGEQFPFFAKAGSGFQRGFLQNASLAHLPRGQFIFHQGDNCRNLALLLEGSVRVYKQGESGREITLYRVEPGQSCVLTASCILSQSPFPATAVCDSDVAAIIASSADVKRWMADSSAWRDYIYGLVAHRLTDIISVVEEVVFRRMDQRIASLLLRRSDESPDGPVTTTHQAIASDLGTSREVVTRILRDFESSGCIALSRGSIRILDVPGLRARSSDAPL